MRIIRRAIDKVFNRTIVIDESSLLILTDRYKDINPATKKWPNDAVFICLKKTSVRKRATDYLEYVECNVIGYHDNPVGVYADTITPVSDAVQNLYYLCIGRGYKDLVSVDKALNKEDPVLMDVLERAVDDPNLYAFIRAIGVYNDNLVSTGAITEMYREEYKRRLKEYKPCLQK